MSRRKRSRKQRQRWTTIYSERTGESPSDDPQLRGRWLEAGEQPQFRGLATPAMRDFLVYGWHGHGPDRPDDSPEPTTTTK